MRRLLIVGSLLLLAGYLLTGLTQVRPGERAVVRRFGRVLSYKPEPGLWVGLPWGMDRVERVSVDLVRPVAVGYQQREDEDLVTPAGQLLTGDHNLVNLQVVLNYSVQPDHVDEYVIQADRVDSLIARAAETLLAEWVAGRTIDEVLIDGKSLLPRWLVEQTRERLEGYRLGVFIQDASVTHLLPPADVKDAFDNVTRAQTEIRTGLHKAEREAAQSLRSAQAEQYRMGQQATAAAAEQLLLAHADADSFERRLEQYRKLRRDNPAFLSGIWWEEMGKLFAQMRARGQIDLLDSHLANGELDIITAPLQKKK
jgi:membrane protease subunit HflK